MQNGMNLDTAIHLAQGYAIQTGTQVIVYELKRANIYDYCQSKFWFRHRKIGNPRYFVTRDGIPVKVDTNAE